MGIGHKRGNMSYLNTYICICTHIYGRVCMCADTDMGLGMGKLCNSINRHIYVCTRIYMGEYVCVQIQIWVWVWVNYVTLQVCKGWVSHVIGMYVFGFCKKAHQNVIVRIKRCEHALMHYIQVCWQGGFSYHLSQNGWAGRWASTCLQPYTGAWLRDWLAHPAP